MFEMLNQSGCTEVETINDKALFDEMNHSFKTMKFNPSQLNAIYRLVGCILLLGNL